MGGGDNWAQVDGHSPGELLHFDQSCVKVFRNMNVGWDQMARHVSIFSQRSKQEKIESTGTWSHVRDYAGNWVGCLGDKSPM